MTMSLIQLCIHVHMYTEGCCSRWLSNAERNMLVGSRSIRPDGFVPQNALHLRPDECFFSPRRHVRWKPSPLIVGCSTPLYVHVRETWDTCQMWLSVFCNVAEV